MTCSKSQVVHNRPIEQMLAGPLETEELISRAQAIGRLEMKESLHHQTGWEATIVFWSVAGSYISAKGSDRSLNAALMAAVDEADAIIAAVGRRP